MVRTYCRACLYNRPHRHRATATRHYHAWLPSYRLNQTPPTHHHHPLHHTPPASGLPSHSPGRSCQCRSRVAQRRDRSAPVPMPGMPAPSRHSSCPRRNDQPQTLPPWRRAGKNPCSSWPAVPRPWPFPEIQSVPSAPWRCWFRFPWSTLRRDAPPAMSSVSSRRPLVLRR